MRAKAIALLLAIGASAWASQDLSAQAVAIEPAENASRQVLVVLDQAQSLPRAGDIVRGDLDKPGVREVLTLFDGVEHIRQFLPDSSTDRLAELRARDPRDPEVLLSEFLVLTLRDGVRMDEFISVLRSHRWVLSAEPNLQFTYSTRYLDQGGSSNLGTYQWGFMAGSPLQLSGASGAWAKLTGSAYLTAIDQGIQWNGSSTHPDMISGFRPQFSGFALPATTAPYIPLTGDFSESFGSNPGHGSHVMGLMFADDAGSGNGVKGACPTCSGSMIRIDVAVLNEDYMSLGVTTAVRLGAQAINMST